MVMRENCFRSLTSHMYYGVGLRENCFRRLISHMRGQVVSCVRTASADLIHTEDKDFGRV